MKLIDADMIMREFGLGDDCDTCIQNKIDCRYIPIYSKMDLCDFVDRAAHDVDLWIPCSERLPENSGRYLVTCELDGEMVVDWNIYYCSERYDGWLWTQYVAAWMPLPEPYKEEKGES